MIKRNDGAVAVRLHATDILTFRPDGTVVLNTNGWRSVTTKARINEFLPCYQVSQRVGTWYYGPSIVDVREGDILNEGSGPVRLLARTAPWRVNHH